MSPPPATFGPRPGESPKAYLDRLNDERLARQRAEAGLPPLEVALAPVAPVAIPVAPVVPVVPAAVPAAVSSGTGNSGRSTSGTSIDDARLAALQAEATSRATVIDGEVARRLGPGGAAWHKKSTGLSIGAALPAQARAASGRAAHDRIHKADLKPIQRETDWTRWQRKIRVEASPHHVGDPWINNIVCVAKAIYFAELGDQRGFAQRSYEALATAAGVCVRTAQRAVEWLEAHGLLDVLNVMRRTDEGDWRRDANLYVASIDREFGRVRKVADYVVRGVSRLAALFGLFIRPGGLNASAARGSPAPN